jgi:hypothetical protein
MTLSLADTVQRAKREPLAMAEPLRALLQQLFPALSIATCSINSGSKVALNSVNGTLTTPDGHAYFFKFHAEEGEEASLQDSEYYRAALIRELGWPVIEPRFVSTAPGRQCVIYDKIDVPTAYDITAQLDADYLATGEYNQPLYAQVLAAEQAYLQHTTAISLASIQPSDPQAAAASLHQLFSHRLHSVNQAVPRLQLFYQGKIVLLPNGESLPFDQLQTRRWNINGRAYTHTLAEIIALSQRVLQAGAMATHPSAVTHGDDHNGNKFLLDGRFVAFDPAFAGRHPLLLGLIKATIHNTVLHPFWYYEPERLQDRLQLKLQQVGDTLHITHNAASLLASPLRQELAALYQAHVWQPVQAALTARNLVPPEADAFMRCAAFCCPFLALNMLDAQRSPHPASVLFNLAQCIEIFHTPSVFAAAE